MPPPGRKRASKRVSPSGGRSSAARSRPSRSRQKRETRTTQPQKDRARQNFEKQQKEQRANIREQARVTVTPKKTTSTAGRRPWEPTKTTVEKRQEDKQGILAAIGHGPVQEGYIGDEAFKKTQAAGQHKLLSQFERLKAKYGDDFAETSQGKLLRDYLSGVPVERGGGLGAFDPESGTAGAGIDINDPGETYRRGLLNQISSGKYGFDDLNLNIDLMRGRDIEGARELTPDQYFKFRQQLMASDPTAGNMAYKQAFPWSSGYGPSKLATPAMSMLKEGIGGLRSLIPETAAGRPFEGFGGMLKGAYAYPEPSDHYGRAFAGSPSVRPDGDRGGVIDAAQSVVNQASPYGSLIGSPGTAGGFVDSDGDGVDDRYQTAAGQPNQGPTQGTPSTDPSTLSFQVAQPAAQASPFADPWQASAYSLPQQAADPRLADWYSNLGILQNAYS